MKKLRWGILSTAKIAREWLIPALQTSDLNEVVAIASRDATKGQTVANELGIPLALDDYDALLQHPDIDAIYNPLPNHLHVPFSLKAIQAGKHVLCEKPVGLNAHEVNELIATTQAHPDVLMMEAFMYRFHPQWKQVLQLIQSGRLGPLLHVEAHFSFFNQDPHNVRNQPGIGGGALMDVGCYCVSVARTVFGKEPKRVVAHMDMDTRFGVDRHTSAILDFAPGHATFYCSMQSAASQHVNIIGEKATLRLDSPFYSRGEPAQLILREDGQSETILIDDTNHYVAQVDAFSEAVAQGSAAPYPLTDALANMQVIDSLFASAKSGGWEPTI